MNGTGGPRHSGTNHTGGCKHSGTNHTGGCKARFQGKPRKRALGTHQESLELTQEAPQMAYELTEPLFIPFHEHGPCQGGRARARAGGGLSELPRPSVEDNIVSRAHTASHRTHERNETISRLDSPPNLRY